MFFLASVTIADRHPDLRGQVAALDDYLQANEGHTFRMGHAARIARLHAELVRRLLECYAAEGAVRREIAYICPTCDGFLGRVPGEGDLWCDICEESVSYRGRKEIGEKAWRTVDGSPKTDYTPLEEENSVVGEKVVVQFIAGDRGGGLISQVKATREEKEIASAINEGTRRNRFDFKGAVYSASLNDVINCHRFRPAIVHFAGHGLERRLVLVEDRDVIAELRPLREDQVGTIFANYPTRVRLVIFNTCHSIALASSLVDANLVDAAIGVQGAITDDHAIAFAASFYRAVSDGLSVLRAFNMAVLHVTSTPSAERPRLLCAAGIDADKIMFAAGKSMPAATVNEPSERTGHE